MPVDIPDVNFVRDTLYPFYDLALPAAPEMSNQASQRSMPRHWSMNGSYMLHRILLHTKWQVGKESKHSPICGTRRSGWNTTLKTLTWETQ